MLTHKIFTISIASLALLVLSLAVPVQAEVAIKKIQEPSVSNISTTRVKLSWQLQPENKHQNLTFQIRVYDAQGNLVSRRRTRHQSLILRYLKPETTYYYKIRAKLDPQHKGRWIPLQSFTTQPEPKQITTTIFGGDVMMSRYVGRRVTSSGDYALPFRNIAAEFAQNDLTFINLEAPFKQFGPYTVEDSAMSFKVDPQMIVGLKLADVNVVSLSNNHIYNAGQAGVDFTKQHLVNNGMAYCLEQPDIRQVKNIKFAFLCYSYDINLNTDKLINDIRSVQDKADVIIVSMHNGAEYTENISASQSNFAHTAIDYGADVVIGHHPHVVQRLEEYKGKYIFYSLGNLIFDQDWSWQTQLGMVVKMTWEDDEAKKIEFKPIKIDNNFQPRFMDFEEGKQVLQRLRVPNYEIQL